MPYHTERVSDFKEEREPKKPKMTLKKMFPSMKVKKAGNKKKAGKKYSK